MGIVGMPNVGKSSLFNILSNLSVPADNYPFCTIDPNTAKVLVPDARFDFLVQQHKPKSIVNAVLTITDIAGLVKGAHEGKGLGNAFLSHINAVDGIYHLVRAFKDAEIDHVEGTVDPVRDLEIISEELILKDIERVKGRIEVVTKMVSRGVDKTKKAELSFMEKALRHLEDKKDIRSGDWDGKEIEILNEIQFLTAKPVIYLINISKDNFETQKNKWLKDIADWVKKRSPDSPVIPFSVTFESELSKMETEGRKKYLEEKKLVSMLPRIITTGYSALDLVHFFTCGPDEVRAWTVRQGTLAPAAAGVIHTDFEKGFIAAEAMSFDDFKKLGSEGAVKAAGKYRTEGKNYLVKDGDIFFFKFNVTGDSKKKKK